MRILQTLTTGIAFAVLSATASLAGEVKIYPYAAHENYCPAGLQPVSIAGVICCGTPNQHVSYQQVMKHPVSVKKHKKRHYSARAHCPVGSKGCS